MLEQRSSQPSRILPFVADASLAVILLGMLLLAVRAVGLASWADPIAIWYGISGGWFALALSFLRSTPQQRATITKHAVMVALVCLTCCALPYGLFTDDILRYQWDGWLTSHGVSPYAFVPSDPALRYLSYSTGSATLPQQLPYADMLTIYPPGAQILFAVASLISGVDAVVWKLTLWLICIVFGITAWRMHDGQQRAWLLLSALSPVVLLHGFVDGHIDLAMALFMMMSISARGSHRIMLSGALLGVAISIKYLPIVALPMILAGLGRREQGRLITAMLAALVLIYVPFIGPNLLGSLGTFTASWQTNSASYSVLAWFVDDALTRPILLILGLVFSGFIIARWRGQPGVSLAMVLVIIAVLSPVVHPWYLIAPLALMPLTPLRSVIVWTFTICLYAVGYSTYKGSGVWLEHPAALAVEFVPVVAALILDYQRGPLSLLHDDRS